MAADTQISSPILKVAWTRYAQLDAASNENSKPHYRWRKWIAWLGVLAAFFAVVSQLITQWQQAYPENGVLAVIGLVIKIVFIATPITGSVLAAFVNKFYGGGNWLVTRAGAEEIQKEIYTYRTVLKNQPNRREWLESRLTDIQRQVYRGLGGELILKPYKGQIPPYYDPNNPNSDPGTTDLTGDEYFRYRLESQLAWHIKKVNQFQAERTRLQIYILSAGGAGALLAAWGGMISLWVALTASAAAAFIGWQELKNYDPTIKNYSKVIMELMIIYDHWTSLEPQERTDSEFFTMVKSTEEILWSQNVEYIKSMQEAVAGAKLEEAQLVDQVIKKAVESDKELKRSMRESVVEFTSKTMDETREKIEEDFKKALGSLAEEASSELVQKELAEMAKAAEQAAQAVAARFSSVSDAVASIAKEYAGKNIGTQTAKEELNQMIARYPANGEVKG